MINKALGQGEVRKMQDATQAWEKKTHIYIYIYIYTHTHTNFASIKYVASCKWFSPLLTTSRITSYGKSYNFLWSNIVLSCTALAYRR